MGGQDKKISMAVIRRLPRYYRHLGELLSSGVLRISSSELSRRMNITASQIRQDLNNFGGFGQQGYGYNVEYLYGEIKKILGVTKEYSMIIVGAGNLGQALANYSNFEKRGFVVKGMFDINPKLIGITVRGIEIQDYDCLEGFLKNNPIDIAILSLPKVGASKVAVDVARWGVKGIWNFSPADLDLPGDVKIENAHLTDTLITLAYRINHGPEEKNRLE